MNDIHSQFERMKYGLTPRQLSRLGAYEASRHAQLQKARREIAENSKHCEEVMKCKCCGKTFSSISENFSGFCWLCRLWG